MTFDKYLIDLALCSASVVHYYQQVTIFHTLILYENYDVKIIHKDFGKTQGL